MSPKFWYCQSDTACRQTARHLSSLLF